MRLTPEREAKIRRFSAQWGGATEDMLIDLLDEIDAMRVELAAVVTGNAANINWRPAVAKTETVAALPECAGCASDLREALDEVRKWLTNDEPSACDLVDSLWTIVEAPEVKRLRLRAAEQQPELPERYEGAPPDKDPGDMTSAELRVECRRWRDDWDKLAHAIGANDQPPAAIVAAASSEDAEALRFEQRQFAIPGAHEARYIGALQAEHVPCFMRATIVDPATHVVLPRAEVEAWIVGLRSYDDDVMFDYMPPALRELLEKST
jgi:hypothetical protein